MEPNQDYKQDIESIRKLMERSVKFISLSGLSGILSGIYALLGAWLTWYLINKSSPPADYYTLMFNNNGLALQLLVIALVVLVASLVTGYLLSARISKRVGAKMWDATSRRMLINLAIPLITGGIFIIILIEHGQIILVAPACLIFYGLALIQASPNTYEEVRYLGYSEIILGLVAAWFAGYGLIFWALGFGVLHILYGAMMYKKYDA
jgi:predicted lysophospholipase L1 biosynthesis ABC-type transport system permease subunit